MATTAVRQKLRALCHDKPWIYAEFWKLKNRGDLLTWEDGYIDNGKSDAYVRNALDHGVLSGKFGTTNFCCKMDIVSGKLVLCPTHIAMAGRSHDSYTTGEGVLCKRQSADTHVWIAAPELNSEILSDCPPEWQLQFVAGIKTVLLVPVIPLGLVQLGSLDMVEEDLNVVAHIKDFFCMLQHTAGASSDVAPILGHVNPLSSVKECLVENLLSSSSLIGNLPNPIKSQQSWGRDFMAFDNGQKNGDEIFPSDHHPYPLFAPEDDFPHQIVTAQVMEMDEEPCGEASIWKIIYGELLGDPNNAIFDHRLCEEEITQISMNLPDNSHLSHDVHDISFAENMSDETLWKNFEAGTIIDDQLLSFPTYCELHKALGSGSLERHADHTWNISSSKTGQANCTLGTYETIIEESKAWLANGNDTGLLLDAVITHSRNGSDDGASEASRYTKSYSSSSEKLSDSCLTQCKAEINPMRFDDSQLLANENGAAGTFDGLMDSPRQYSSNGSNLFSNGGHQKKGTSKLHPIAKRRGKSNDLHKPRPRDRQLIQDRVKELRELIPNGSKCSIDALLDRTVKHMLFLKNLSSQTEKLQHCSYSKVQVKEADPCLSRAQTHQDQVSWAYHLGRMSKQFPLIIESLDQPGHLLVEMLCSDYGLFLEIAQVLRSMRLTILKGVLKNKSEELWAHFIVETSRGFHRLDILLPLMRLLQRNFPSETPVM